MEQGIRVGAIKSANSETVKLYGYGVYTGDLTHPELEIPNPNIILDDGRVVWGCECWWGPEEKIKKFIGSRTVETV